MTASLRLPRVLANAANADLVHQVEGATLEEALTHLFHREPGLRHHLLDENGEIRRHVSVFVDREQADLHTPIREGAEIQLLQAVSGGFGPVRMGDVGQPGDRS